MAIYPFYGTGHPFSNFTKSTFIVDGVNFACGEQWMMAAKARLFDDIEIYNKILRTSTPTQIKKLGRQVKNFDDDVWKSQRYGLVKTGLLEKFRQNQAYKELLISTGDQIIVEASPTDKIWGVGLKETDPKIHDPSKWKGLNLLGKVLMEIRQELQPR